MSHVNDGLLDAIAQVESGNNPEAQGDLELANPALGAFQMRLPAYQDVQRLYPKEFGHLEFGKAMQDPALQRQAARRYLEILEGPYGLTDLPSLIAGYNAGPSVKKRGIRNPDYVAKVQAALANPTLEQFHAARP